MRLFMIFVLWKMQAIDYLTLYSTIEEMIE